jgi:hypothetical protein
MVGAFASDPAGKTLRVAYFRETIGVRSEYRYITALGVWVVEGNVLFHSQVQGFFLLIGGSARVFADMLGFHDMLDNAKRRRHGYC